jgi:hypothetical protein
MPILAALISSVVAWFWSAISTIGWYIHLVTWARRALFVALGVALFTAIGTCVSSILGMLSASGLSARFLMGLGMFIPSNAGAVMACLGSIYLACIVYRLKLTALKW